MSSKNLGLNLTKNAKRSKLVALEEIERKRRKALYGVNKNERIM